MHAQVETSTTLRLTRIETGNDGGGCCPLFVAGYDAWDDLSLEYRVPWPVHLLLTPPVRSLNDSTTNPRVHGSGPGQNFIL